VKWEWKDKGQPSAEIWEKETFNKDMNRHR